MQTAAYWAPLAGRKSGRLGAAHPGWLRPGGMSLRLREGLQADAGRRLQELRCETRLTSSRFPLFPFFCNENTTAAERHFAR